MTPKVRGIGSRLKKLREDFNRDAERLVKDMEAIDGRRQEVVPKVQHQLATARADLTELEQLAKEMEQTNGGPLLDDSETPSPPRSSEVAAKG